MAEIGEINKEKKIGAPFGGSSIELPALVIYCPGGG
jgi:hypothetical protein